MSGFSDGEIKRLEEMCTEKIGSEHTFWRSLEALLTRLGCAEAVIDASFDPRGKAYIGYDDWHEKLAKWRKSKGGAGK